MNSITINNNSIERKLYNNQPVVTFKDIDFVHERPDGTANRNFRTNKKHFIENVDYYKISSDEIRRNRLATISDAVKRPMLFFTESGYLMLVKSFTDDLAWEVQRQLVNSYFRLKEINNNEPYKVKNKTYMGVPCMTVKDLAFLCGYDRSSISIYVRENSLGELLTYNKLKDFKRENTDYEDVMRSMYVLYKKDVLDVVDNFRKLNECRGFLDEYFYESKSFENDLKSYLKVRDLFKFYKVMKSFNLERYISEDITEIISKEFVKYGLIEKPFRRCDINSHDGWNLYGRFNELGRKLE